MLDRGEGVPLSSADDLDIFVNSVVEEERAGRRTTHPKTFIPSYLPSFHSEIQETVVWSEDQFGTSAFDRYGLLIQQTLRDVLEEPTH